MPTLVLRRWLPLVVLAFIAAGAWSAAGAANLDDPMLTPIEYDESLATPMFSARRVPQTLQQPIADDAVMADADLFFAKLARETPAGANWCVTVDIDGFLDVEMHLPRCSATISDSYPNSTICF